MFDILPLFSVATPQAASGFQTGGGQAFWMAVPLVTLPARLGPTVWPRSRRLRSADEVFATYPELAVLANPRGKREIMTPIFLWRYFQVRAQSRLRQDEKEWLPNREKTQEKLLSVPPSILFVGAEWRPRLRASAPVGSRMRSPLNVAVPEHAPRGLLLAGLGIYESQIESQRCPVEPMWSILEKTASRRAPPPETHSLTPASESPE